MKVSVDRKTARAAIAGLALLMPASASAQQPPSGAESVPEPAAASAPEKKAAPVPKSLTAWRGKVLAHLNSRKREFGSGAGTATVAFKIDRSGEVASAKVVTSSGNKALDAEAVALTQRASPVPPPPADVPGTSLYLKVPVRFGR
jgi:protein TonB